LPPPKKQTNVKYGKQYEKSAKQYAKYDVDKKAEQVI
jgi:hypothetical protein